MSNLVNGSVSRPCRRASRLPFGPSLGRLMATALLGVVAFACAETRDPIDRVQPNAIAKPWFDGEWYYQRTVVDVPASNGFTFVGNTDHSGVARITFELQENYLFVRRRTELIKGGDIKATDPDAFLGEVIAAFPIEKHFDIRHAYNPTTGEELNVMEENSSDRPWYERDYVRVDWSNNQVHNYQLDFEAHSIESVPYYVQDLQDGKPNPDAPTFDKAAHYFDVTSRIFAKAGTIYYEGYGDIPLCWLMGQETSECGAGQYSIRHSFWQVDKKREYLPRPYKGVETEMFGFFAADRMVYDSKDGIKIQHKERYLQRHNIWKNWTKTVSRGECDSDPAYTGLNKCICADVGDVKANSCQAPLALSERQVRPIVYFLNDQFPDDLVATAQGVADQWNKVYKDVVAAAANPYTGDMFILCTHNPVQAGDDPACGPVGTHPRLGDIRYSFMAYVPKYMKYGLLGLGPSNNDPETGEILSGMAYVYHHNNTAAWRTVQQLQLLNGDLDPQDYVDGTDLTEWLEQMQSGKGRFERRGLDEATTMVDRIANNDFSKYWAGQRTDITPADEAFQQDHGFGVWVEPKLQDMYGLGHLNGLGNSPEARLQSIRGTQAEKLLAHPEIKMAAGLAPDAVVDDAMLEKVSMSRDTFRRFLGERDSMHAELAAKRNMYLAEIADEALIGVAKDVKGKTSEEAYQMIRHSIYTAVLAHEVGHSLGLMHNFGGSDDAVNYFDDYWKLRDDGKVGPRLVDPITDEELDGKIYNYAYSSIMDYAGRYTIDGLGVGKYDRAAMLYGYADKVEVFEDVGTMGSTMPRWFSSDGDLISFTQFGPSATHYTSIYNALGAKLYEASNRKLVDVSALSGNIATATVGGKIYTRVPYIYCSHGRSDLSDNCLTRDYGADAYERMSHFLDEWDGWYLLRAFPRGDLGVNNWSYASRNYGRIYHRIKYWHDIYALYAALLPRYYPPEMVANFLKDPVNGWGSKTWGVQNAFQYLIETMLMPDVGAYGQWQRPDGTMLMANGYSKPVGGNLLDIGVEQARYYSTSWSPNGAGTQECGYFWWECLHHVGFYVDKVLAMMAMSDSNTNFVARANPIDLREWRVSYYNTFSDNVRAINAAMQSGDWSRVGPYLDKGKIRFPNYTAALGQKHVAPVDPAADFTIQLYFSLLGQARFMTNFDRRFVDEAQVWIVGNWKAPEVGAQDQVTFTDPDSGLIFGALNRENGAGAAMVAQANLLRSRSDLCDEGPGGDSAPKTATLADDCDLDVSGDDAVRATAGMRDYVQLIKAVAEMSFAMEYGSPLDP